LFGNDAPNTLIGRGGDDHLNAAGGDDKIDGGKGDDYINGGHGNDYMAGGPDNDTYVVDSASDIVREYTGEGTDTVEVHLEAYALPANVENAYMMAGGTATHSLYGNSLVNHLHGGASSNRLFGGEGDDHLFGYRSTDFLDGGPGADRMAGGDGDDTFVLRRGETDGDVLVDFSGAYGWPGDSIIFLGFGSGASLTRDDATHWTVHSGDGLVHETFEVLTGRTIVESDYFFV
jgi:Ca2+-binding RTX toxin-like protein